MNEKRAFHKDIQLLEVPADLVWNAITSTAINGVAEVSSSSFSFGAVANEKHGYRELST